MQIVSLGAGFDTLFFRLLRQKQPRASTASLTFLEVDCQAIVDAKRSIVTQDAATFAALFTPDARQQEHQQRQDGHDSAGIALQCRVDRQQASYALAACDLGDVTRLETLVRTVELDPSLPTLVLAECVLVRVCVAILLSFLGSVGAHGVPLSSRTWIQ